MATESHLCQLPILQAKRDLVTRPIQPNDVQRVVYHIAFSPLVPQTRSMAPICVSSFFRNRVQGGKREKSRYLAPSAAPSESGRKRARRAALTTFHSVDGCAQTHTIHRIQVGPNTVETSNTNFPHISGLCPSATIGSLRCSSQSANLVLFLPRMLSSRVGSKYDSPASLGCLHFPVAFAFWASSHSPAHLFVSIV